MIMNKISVFFLALLSINALAQKVPKQSIAFEKPPVIDGNMEDWPSDWWLDPDGKFISNIGNDAENLYVRLKISDDLTQQKIAWFGLSLKFNPSGKRKGKLGLKYPVQKDMSEIKKERPKNPSLNERQELIQTKKYWIEDAEVVELIGLAKQNIISSRLGLANGVEVIIVAEDDGAYIYEAKIPFKAFKINKNEVNVLGVEFETGKFVAQNKNTSTTSSQMNPAYQNAMRGTGYYGGTPLSGSGYQYNPYVTPGYFFLQVKLN